MSEDWVAIYKFGRLALLAVILVAIGAWVYWPTRKQRLEEPARRMLEEDDA